MPNASRLRRFSALGRPLRPGVRRACAVLTLIVLIVVAAIVLYPAPPAAGGQHALKVWLASMHAMGVLPEAVTFALVESLSNVVMFVPIGLLAAGAVVPRRRWTVIPAAAALSSLIEWAQLAVPNRVSSWTDVVANSAGACVGVAALVGISTLVAIRPLLAARVTLRSGRTT